MRYSGLARIPLVFLQIAVCLCGRLLWPQNDPGHDDSRQEYKEPVLRVETSLIQIPVLVLTPELKELPTQVNFDRFSISFGRNRSIRPTYARLEGDEPIELAIVLDTRSLPADQLAKIDESIANLAPTFLHARDRVSIYVVDCSTINGVKDVPAEPIQLKIAVDRALNAWTARQLLKKKAPCSSATHLWSNLAYVSNTLWQQPGWRAIIALTEGNDRKSQRSRAILTTIAQMDQVAIFGLDPSQDAQQIFALLESGKGVLAGGMNGGGAPSDLAQGPSAPGIGQRALWTLSESSGGLAMPLYKGRAGKQMQQIVEMLRERYILEFPRPSALKPGNQIMTIRIDRSDALIHPAGDGIPVANQALVENSADGHSETRVATPTVVTQAILPPVEQQPAVQGAAGQPPTQNPVAHETSAQTSPEQHPHVAGELAPEIAEPLFKVSTRLTVEDVTVSDKDRRPVHGLVQSNFSIEEDGQPQTIRNFEECGEARPSERAAPPQLPANVFTNARPQAPTTSAVNVILLDSVSTGSAIRLARVPESLAYARQQSMKYLSKLPEGTQVAILQMGSELSVLQGFTTDKTMLLTAMKGSLYKPTAATYVESTDDPMAEWCKAANEQSELTLSGLNRMAAYLSGIKGKKNIIWFTLGIPWLTDYPKFSQVSCLNDHTDDLEKSLTRLIAAEVTLYPVDPRGMFTDSANSAMSDSFASKTGLDVATEATGFSANSSADHNSLRDMADATGGVPYYNRNDVDASVAEAIQTGADYYSPSYVPPLTKYDGKYHSIEVKLDRPGLHLQYHTGYTAVDLSELAPPSASGLADEATENKLFSAMGQGEAASTQLLFDVRVTPSTLPKKPGDPEVIGSVNPTLKQVHLVRYDFAYSIAPDQISLLDAFDGRRIGSVKFAFIVYDGADKMLNVLAETMKINPRADEVAQFMLHPLQVPLQFDLPPEKILVRLGVMDMASQKIGTL